MGRRKTLNWPARIAGSVACCLALVAAASAQTLRVGFTGPLDSLDPQRATSMFAQQHAALLFDQLLTYDYFARPVALVPLAAEALPTVSADGREYTFRIRPGIQFAPHPAFGGKPRELVAADFVYSVKRLADPKVHAPSWGLYRGAIEGLDAQAEAAAAGGRALDYDAPISGAVAVDRYTLRIRLTHVDRAFVYLFASPTLSAVPREVVEASGDRFGLEPVGSGPYVLREYSPNSRLVVERNPAYRALRIRDVAPGSPADPAFAAGIADLRYPASARIEFSHIPEPTTARLALERGEVDVVALAQPAIALKNGRPDPALARTGMQIVRGTTAGSLFLIFNMRDPVIGGVGRQAMALRRAIAMAFDDREYAVVLAGGAAEFRDQPVPPGIEGHVAGFRTRNGYDPVAANALLDRLGFTRGKDGWRTAPDGGRLALTMMVGTSSESRRYAEFMKRMLDRIAVRLAFEHVPAGDRLSRIFACRFQLTTMDWGLDTPDGSNILLAFHGKSQGNVGLSCLQDSEYDAAFERLVATPLGPARAPIYAELLDRIDVLMPVRTIPFDETMYLARPGVRGLAVHPALAVPFAYVTVGAGESAARAAGTAPR